MWISDSEFHPVYNPRSTILSCEWRYYFAVWLHQLITNKTDIFVNTGFAHITPDSQFSKQYKVTALIQHRGHSAAGPRQYTYSHIKQTPDNGYCHNISLFVNNSRLSQVNNRGICNVAIRDDELAVVMNYVNNILGENRRDPSTGDDVDTIMPPLIAIYFYQRGGLKYISRANTIIQAAITTAAGELRCMNLVDGAWVIEPAPRYRFDSFPVKIL